MRYPNIEAERARRGMSKEEFAKKLGISTKTYYNWINGVNPIPSDALIEMGGICHVNVGYLLGVETILTEDEKGA
ncbi:MULTISPECIES: helix-turn-helix transcriptional regulator [unclassified Hungatella]|uniref:helix-turn-helix domain-containing protein n=1 Tax=unclassified Hungatella TaxID=2613923 RepID=UPI00210E0B0C|nr:MULTISPECIES: helix-turn-helix transcriptional regulator [unclassified Hungatella]MCI6451926.1 helix-turn-helix domain-containing protein [Hungatella sp.]MCQ4832742.1 helix-turn-helix domain-containing protein [Hungatella sp. SL.1.14]